MTNRIFTAISYSGFGTVVRQAAQIAVTIISARNFGPTAMGELAAILAVVSLIQLLGVTGLGASVVKAKKISEILPTALTVTLMLAGVATLTLSFFWPFVSIFYNFKFATNIGIAITLYTALKIFSTALESILLNSRSFVRLGLIELVSHVIALAAFFAALSLNKTFSSVFYFYVVQALSGAIILVWICRDKIRFSFDRHVLMEILRFSVPYSASQIGSTAAANADNLLIGKLQGNIILGFYSRAYQLLVAPAALVGQVVQRIAFSYISHAENPLQSSREFLVLATFPMALVGFQSASVCWFYSEDLISWIYGPEWELTAEVLGILSLSMFFRLHYKLLESLLFAVGSATRVAKFTSMYAIIVIGITAYFGVYGTIYNIAYGIAISIFVYWLFLYIDVRRLMQWSREGEFIFITSIVLSVVFSFGLNYILSLARIHWAFSVALSSIGALSLGLVYFVKKSFLKCN